MHDHQCQLVYYVGINRSYLKKKRIQCLPKRQPSVARTVISIPQTTERVVLPLLMWFGTLLLRECLSNDLNFFDLDDGGWDLRLHCRVRIFARG